MSQPGENGASPGTDASTPAALPTRTGGWTPARPAPPEPERAAAPPATPDRSAGPAQRAPQLPPAAPPALLVTAPAWPVATTDPVVTEPVVTAPADADPADDDPDRLRPDELPWGVPARALVGSGGRLPPPAVVARHRSPAAVARLVALAVIIAAIVVLAALVLTR